MSAAAYDERRFAGDQNAGPIAGTISAEFSWNYLLSFQGSGGDGASYADAPGGMQADMWQRGSEIVVGGDGLSLSIAAASIVAKVTRDRIMAELAGRHPGYGWERNAGYGTAEHRVALDRLGVTGHHRKSFRPIAEKLV